MAGLPNLIGNISGIGGADFGPAQRDREFRADLAIRENRLRLEKTRAQVEKDIRTRELDIREEEGKAGRAERRQGRQEALLERGQTELRQEQREKKRERKVEEREQKAEVEQQRKIAKGEEAESRARRSEKLQNLPNIAADVLDGTETPEEAASKLSAAIGEELQPHEVAGAMARGEDIRRGGITTDLKDKEIRLRLRKGEIGRTQADLELNEVQFQKALERDTGSDARALREEIGERTRAQREVVRLDSLIGEQRGLEQGLKNQIIQIQANQAGAAGAAEVPPAGGGARGGRNVPAEQQAAASKGQIDFLNGQLRSVEEVIEQLADDRELAQELIESTDTSVRRRANALNRRYVSEGKITGIGVAEAAPAAR